MGKRILGVAVGTVIGGAFAVSAHAGLPTELVGAWRVPSNFPGKTVAAYTIGEDGRVKTELPRVGPDAWIHLMNDGVVTDLGGGNFKLWCLPCGMYANQPGKLGSQFAAAADKKKGIAFKLDKTVTPAKLVWDLEPPLKDWFPDNFAMTSEELEKAKRESDARRDALEKSPWVVESVAKCDDPVVKDKKFVQGSAKLFDKFFAQGATFRFKREGDKRTMSYFADPEAIGTYEGAYLEGNLQVTWDKLNKKNEVVAREALSLVDQGEVPGKPGTRTFRTNVGGECRDVVASNPATAGVKKKGPAGGGGGSGPNSSNGT